MAKEIALKIKLQAPGGQATPAPPIGPALGQHGVNIGQFVSQFNERTKDLNGTTVPVVITVFTDKSFIFETKIAPMSSLIKKAVGIAVASGQPNKEKVGEVTEEQVKEIAKQKLPDLNTDDIEAAMNIVRGTARSMGINVVTEPTGKDYTVSNLDEKKSQE